MEARINKPEAMRCKSCGCRVEALGLNSSSHAPKRTRFSEGKEALISMLSAFNAFLRITVPPASCSDLRTFSSKVTGTTN
jgi:hypothetical protein